ncbi:MAG TPA: protein translocase subunit SecD [Terriglobales bacterium]|nr:protein translocase subunit SecD [Terriglobales bacterium]
MKKNLWGRAVLILAVLLAFVYGIVGWPQQWSRRGLLDALQQRIHLGLDLKGGTHLVLQVMVDDAVNTETDRAVERLKDQLKTANINYAQILKPDPTSHPELIQVKGVSPDASGDFKRVVQDGLPDYDPTLGAENSWTLTLKPTAETELKNRAVTQAIQTISTRINELGVTEPTVQEQGLGQYQILVQLPGVYDLARVKEVIQSTAMLEIRQALDGSRSYASQQDALNAHQGMLPPDAVLLPGRPAPGDQGEGQVWWVISRTAAVSGSDLRRAMAGTDESGRPEVNFELTADGGKRFARFTGAHVNDSLAIVLDGKVIEVARIDEQIHDTGRIKGAFTQQQVNDLVMVLNSGALPASIHYLDQETVGASLGAESIREGVTAAIVGMAAVLVFMLVYYKGAGINADLALILNLVILLGFLGYSSATLTLPGIAGVILTVGMGVDSNVLIFERIREELRNGKAPGSAVDQGFQHAWVTIVDTHVTTIVSAAILFLFGTGPVRGFAVTLTFGLLANLFTAVFVSRTIFDAILNRKQRGEAISI